VGSSINQSEQHSFFSINITGSFRLQGGGADKNLCMCTSYDYLNLYYI